MLERNAPHIIDGRFDDTGAPLRNLLKDLQIITALAAELGLPVPATTAAREAFADMAARGMGEKDPTALSAVLDAGTT